MVDEDRLKEMVTTDDRSMVLVENHLAGYHSRKEYVDVERALLGEAKGIWTIVRKNRPRQEEIKVPKRLEVLGRGDLGLGPGQQAPEKQSYGEPGRGVRKRRVAWVQDQYRLGGAEISGSLVVRVGEDCGFDIVMLTQTSDFRLMESTFRGSDLIVLNNIWGFNQEQMRAILEAVYSRRVPYVKYEHDHRELGRKEFSRRLFQNSLLNVFLSPVHLKNHAEALGIEGLCFPLAIDVDLFRPVPGIERKENSALVSNTRNFKTWEKLQRYVTDHPDVSFTVLGDPVVEGPGVVQRELVPHLQMPAIYSEHESLVHLLDGWGAGERVLFEAALCGCKVVTDGQSGHSSWGKEFVDGEGLRDWLRQAPFDFWREIDRRLR